MYLDASCILMIADCMICMLSAFKDFDLFFYFSIFKPNGMMKTDEHILQGERNAFFRKPPTS